MKHIAFILVLLWLFVTGRCTVSYTSDGDWEKVEDREQPACKQFMCSPDGYTWKDKVNTPILYNNVTGCDALVKKGIKKIMFYGDSYMRHVYAAMLITLNGNYESGSMANPARDTSCRYQTLFMEKKCNYHNLNHYGMVCDGRVLLDPVLIGIHDSIFSLSDGTVALWSFGSHQLAKGRYGVNDHVAYQKHFENEGTCPYFREHSEKLTGTISEKVPYTVWWLSTHQRLQQHFPDESPDSVRQYNNGMRQFIDAGQCGKTNYIDVFNVTERLVANHLQEAGKLTWDQVHWGFEVNLVKAQIVLNALLS